MATIKRQQRAYRRRLSRFRSLQLTLYNNICALFDRPRASLEGRIRMRTICLTICYTFQRLTQDTHLEIPSATWLNRNPSRVFLTFCHEFIFPRELIRIVPRLSTTLSRWMNAKNSVSCALRVNVNSRRKRRAFTRSTVYPTLYCFLHSFASLWGLYDRLHRVFCTFCWTTSFLPERYSENFPFVRNYHRMNEYESFFFFCIILCKLCFMLCKTGRMTVKESRITVISRIQIANLKREIRVWWMYYVWYDQLKLTIWNSDR